MPKDATENSDAKLCSTSSIVKQCVDDLFNVGKWNEAERLVIQTASGKDGGGYCRGAVEKIVTSAVEASPHHEWPKLAEKAINDLLNAHEALDRDALGQALFGLRLLVGR